MARTEASIRVLIGSSGDVKSLAPLDFFARRVWEQVAGAARRDEGGKSRANPISAARYPNRNGGRHCCQPPLRRAKDLPVFVTWLIEAFAPSTRSRSWLTSSGVASHLAVPSCEEPGCSTRLRRPKVRWSFDRPGLALLRFPIRRPNLSRGQNRPMFCGPSWGNRSCVPLRSPKFRRTPGTASRERQLPLPAPLPGWPRFRSRKSLGNACRRRSDLWSPAASSFRCRLSDEAGTAVPIT